MKLFFFLDIFSISRSIPVHNFCTKVTRLDGFVFSDESQTFLCRSMVFSVEYLVFQPFLSKAGTFDGPCDDGMVVLGGGGGGMGGLLPF